MKRAFIIVAVIAAVALVFVGWAYIQADRSVHLFARLSAAAASNDFTTARALVRSNVVTITDSAILYGDIDVTRELAVARPQFGKTFEFYLTDPSRFECGKVLLDSLLLHFSDGSARRFWGYATIRDGHFAYFKLHGVDLSSASRHP